MVCIGAIQNKRNEATSNIQEPVCFWPTGQCIAISLLTHKDVSA